MELPSGLQVAKRGTEIRAQVKGAKAPRADAVRNRERLLAAADRMFRERGAQASLDEVATQAGVGIGTLYRHFPTREALLAAACDERLLQLAAASRSRSARLRGHAALRKFLAELVAHASTYRGLASSLGVVLRSHAAGCQATTEEGQRLLREAQLAGEIQKDAELDDIICMAMAISLAAAQDETSAKRIPRLVDMFIDGICKNRPRIRKRA